MIRTGDTIENPITGERVTFLATSVDTRGEAVVIETVVQPHGFVAAAHVHPAQSERFAVVVGTLGLKVGRAVGGFTLIGAGLAMLVGLIGQRIQYGPGTGYTGPTRPPRLGSDEPLLVR